LARSGIVRRNVMDGKETIWKQLHDPSGETLTRPEGCPLN